MRRNRKARSLLALLLAGALTVGMVPMSARAASSSEIQKEIDALEEQNAAIQRELDAIQSQYDENYSNMASTVEQKAAISPVKCWAACRFSSTTLFSAVIVPFRN